MALNQKGVVRFQSKCFTVDGDLFKPTVVPDDYLERREEYLRDGIPSSSFAGVGKPRVGAYPEKIVPTRVPEDYLKRREYYLEHGIPGTSFYGVDRDRHGAKAE